MKHRRSFVIALATGVLLLGAVALIISQRRLIHRLKDESARLRAEILALRAPFGGIAQEDIPGRYQCTDFDADGNVLKDQVLVLHPDHTFTVYSRQDGQPTNAQDYKWHLHPQGFVINWQLGMSLFTRVEAPGVYISSKRDNKTLRLKRIE